MPPPPSSADLAWDLVHARGMPLQTAARRLSMTVPALLELLAEHAPVVRDREWTALRHAGEAPSGREDWYRRRVESVSGQVKKLRGEALEPWVIAERLGVSPAVVNSFTQADDDY